MEKIEANLSEEQFNRFLQHVKQTVELSAETIKTHIDEHVSHIHRRFDDIVKLIETNNKLLDTKFDQNSKLIDMKFDENNKSLLKTLVAAISDSESSGINRAIRERSPPQPISLMCEGNGENKNIGEISSKQQIGLISAQTRTIQMTSVENAENASPGEQPFAAHLPQLPISKSIPPKTVTINPVDHSCRTPSTSTATTSMDLAANKSIIQMIDKENTENKRKYYTCKLNYIVREEPPLEQMKRSRLQQQINLCNKDTFTLQLEKFDSGRLSYDTLKNNGLNVKKMFKYYNEVRKNSK